MAAPDPEMQALQKTWAPKWRLWRSRNNEGELNNWCATHRSPSLTLMEPTASDLAKALEKESNRSAIHG